MTASIVHRSGGARADEPAVPPVASGTSRVMTVLGDGSVETAYQAADTNLYTTGEDGLRDWQQGMMPGTSPSIAALAGGGIELAFQANTGALITVGDAAWKDWGLAMMPGTSPSITALPDGGFEVAFQGSNTDLWTAGESGVSDWGLGMMADTSPSIASLPGMSDNASVEIAFQANTSDLWTVGNWDHDWGLGMAPDTSPSLTAMLGSHYGSGDFETAFEANTQQLWTVGTSDDDWILPMAAGTSPSITATVDGGYQVAYQDSDGVLASVGGAIGESQGSWGVKLAAGDSPSAGVLPNGRFVATMAGDDGDPVDLDPDVSTSPYPNMLSVGDSFSSGEGAGNYYDTTCDRTMNAWPALLSQFLNTTNFTFDACSGAVLSQISAQEQSQDISAMDLITVTGGGNDANFGPALQSCLVVGNCSGLTLTTSLANQIMARATSMYRDIANRAPNARIVVMGYPDIFPQPSEVANGCGTALTGWSGGPATNWQSVHTSLRLLNQALSQAAASASAVTGHNVEFYNPNSDPRWTQHSICSSDPWGNSIGLSSGSASLHTKGYFHPNQEGNSALCVDMLEYITGDPNAPCAAPDTQVASNFDAVSQPVGASEYASAGDEGTLGDQTEACTWTDPTIPDSDGEQPSPPATDTGDDTPAPNPCAANPQAEGCGNATETITYRTCEYTPGGSDCPYGPTQNTDVNSPGNDTCFNDPTAAGCDANDPCAAGAATVACGAPDPCAADPSASSCLATLPTPDPCYDDPSSDNCGLQPSPDPTDSTTPDPGDSSTPDPGDSSTPDPDPSTSDDDGGGGGGGGGDCGDDYDCNPCDAASASPIALPSTTPSVGSGREAVMAAGRIGSSEYAC